MKKIDFDANLSFDSPIGLIELFARDNHIVHLAIGAANDGALNPLSPNPKSNRVLEQAKKQLNKYFVGKLDKLDFDVAVEGTEFQRAVWRQIDQIRFGKSLTYAQIADAIGKPKAVRAVGSAVGANPVPIRIGCHRVLGSNGAITGFSAGEGIATKRQLLDHEGLIVA